MRGGFAAALVLFLLLSLLVSVQSYRTLKPAVPAIFVFGDSLLDAATNNYIKNSTIVATMHPYGETFFNHPTGRFTDGRTMVDFLSSSLGLPAPLPYLKPGALFYRGANFASAGSGFLDSTDRDDGIVNLKTQLEQFRNLTGHLKLHRKDVLQEYFTKSAVLLGVGSNDIANNYLSNFTLMFSETSEDFVNSMLDLYVGAVKELHEIGTRKILTLALGPIGCAPKARYQAKSFGLADEITGCFEGANQLALAFNEGLEQALRNLTMELQDAQLVLMKPYNIMLEVIQKPSAAGFVNTTDACCGAGPFNAALRCGLFYAREDGRGHSNPGLKPRLCSQYLFWDYVHPTEAAHHLLMSNFWYGNVTLIEPVNLGELFKGYYVPNPLPKL